MGLGLTCCKSPFSPKLPNLRNFFANCPLQFCQDTNKVKQEATHIRTRKFSCSDISGPLPLGTVVTAPKRPPRKRKPKISRCQSLNYLIISSAPELVRSKSAIELSIDSINNKIMSIANEKSSVHLTPLIVPVDAVNTCTNSTALSLQQTVEILPPYQPPNEVISQNKRTFLATLLEENNNVCNDMQKDNVKSISRKSSITESLREFESSLYEMLQENLEDDHSEHSLPVPSHKISR